jgi:hypothetical protein
MYLKRYDDFINEEINLKKALVGAAIGSSMLLNSPALTQTNTKKEKDSVLIGRVDSPIVVDKIKIGEMSTDSIQLHYLDENNTWKSPTDYNSVPNNIGVVGRFGLIRDVLNFIKTEEIKGYDKVLLSMSKNRWEYSSTPRDEWSYLLEHSQDYFYIFDKNDFDSIGNLELNKTFKFKISELFIYPKEIVELDKSLKEYLDGFTFYPGSKERWDKDMIFYIKIGYSGGRKMVRFNLIDTRYKWYDFDKLYYEVSYNEFIKLINK